MLFFVTQMDTVFNCIFVFCLATSALLAAPVPQRLPRDAADVVAHPAVGVVKPTVPLTFAQRKFHDYLHGLIEEDQVSEEQEVQDLKKKVIQSDSNTHFNQFQLYLLESVTPVVALILFTCAITCIGLLKRKVRAAFLRNSMTLEV